VSRFPNSLNLRRGAFSALLVGGVLLMAIGFLRSGVSSAGSSGTYVEASIGVPIRVSPLSEHTNDTEHDLAALVFSGLMRLRADGLPEPELAERWEVTPDGLTYTFHLREGLTWHDGAAVDAADVAFTIAQIQAESFTGSAALAAEWEGVQVFVADSLTVLVRLPEPAADFLVRATLGLVPEHLADEMRPSDGFAASSFERHPVGTGPFRLTRLGDDRAILEHNTSYVLGTPAIRRIEVRFAATAEAQARMVRGGAVDGALLPDDSTDIEALAEASGLAALPLQSNSFTILYINNARPPLNNPTLRRAIAASIDPARVLRDAQQAGVPGEGVVVPGSWAYEPPEDAGVAIPLASLWAGSQWPMEPSGFRERGGTPLRLELVTNGEPERLAMAQAIARQLEEQGVTVEIVAQSAQRVISDYLRPGTYELALFGWEAGADPDPYTGWHTSQIAAGNVAGFSDAEADVLLEVARTTLDVAERKELYRLFAERFEELGASRVIAYPQRVYLHPERLSGLSPGLLFTSASRFADVHLWRLR
jgi:peptide/nickel transport system substrate-binding protein